PHVTDGIALLVLWVVIYRTKMPKASTATTTLNFWPTVKRLAGNHYYVFGVIAQFCYGGVQTCVWWFIGRVGMDDLAVAEASASNYYVVSLIVSTLFRFINTSLMNYVKPSVLLALSSFIAIISTFIAIITGGYVGVIALVAISGFMSLMFPTIFGLASKG